MNHVKNAALEALKKLREVVHPDDLPTLEAIIQNLESLETDEKETSKCNK